ncbi:MAG: hypothetical protein ACHREM_31910 [Polyangiales bacterium]
MPASAEADIVVRPAMCWTDFYLEHAVDDDALRDAIADVLSTEVDEVEVVGTILDSNAATSVTIVRTSIGGDFVEAVQVYVRPERRPAPEGDLAKLRRLSALLEVRLIGDVLDVNPNGWIVVRPDGEVSDALLEQEPLDEENVFVLRDEARVALATRRSRST